MNALIPVLDWRSVDCGNRADVSVPLEGFESGATGRKRYNEAIKSGLQTKKYALPPGVRPGGHGGSHGYLGDDFIDAILRGRKPAVDVIDALNMTVPGYYAHLSATRDGESLKIPQYSL
jgi:hypothetical protein